MIMISMGTVRILKELIIINMLESLSVDYSYSVNFNENALQKTPIFHLENKHIHFYTDKIKN